MSGVKNALVKSFIKPPENHIFWLLIALLVKGIFFIIQIHQHFPNTIPGFVGAVATDTNSYLDPIDNFLKTGTFTAVNRMPGYGACYFLLRLIFAKVMACNVLIMFQLIADAVSVYALALIARSIFLSDKLFYITFFAYLISTYTSIFDSILLTESLTTSALIFSLYFFIDYTQKHALKRLFISAVFLTAAIFLRPVYFPLLCLLGLFLVVDLYKKKRTLMLKAIICFTMPFLLAESCWMIRNYRVNNTVTPFIRLYIFYPYYTAYPYALDRFIASWGGDFANMDPEVKWFWAKADSSIIKSNPKNDGGLPGDIYTSKFNIDSLDVLRNDMAIVKYADTPAQFKADLNNLLIDKFDAYTLSERSEHPYIYYVKAPLIITYKFLVHSGSYNLFNKPYYKLNFVEMAYKAFMNIMYIWVMAFGLLGAFYYCKHWFKFNTIGVLSLLTLYSILVYPLILRFTEYRYAVPAYPFVLLFACTLSYKLLQRYSGNIAIKINKVFIF